MKMVGTTLVGLTIAGASWAQVTERVDLDYLGHQAGAGGDFPSGASATLSADGRYVVFESSSALAHGDTNFTWDVMVRDRLVRTTELISVDPNGLTGNGVSGLYGVWVTPDGRYVAYESVANNLVPGDTNGVGDVFLRDRWNGTTERVSVATGGAQGDHQSEYPSISADGRYVAFTSEASNFVGGDTNGTFDVFVRDRWNGTTELVSVGMGGGNGDAGSYYSAISDDGQFVAFESFASNLVLGDTNGNWDVFVWSRSTGAIERVSVSTGGAQGNDFSYRPGISSNGRYVGFTSMATNLVPGDTNGTGDAFVRDRRSGTTERVSVTAGGGQFNWGAGLSSLSADGRYAVLSAGYIFVRDRLNGTTEMVSVSTGGARANNASQAGSISPEGRYVSFWSSASNLVPGDTNHNDDVFLHDRAAAGFQSICWPGSSGVLPCPCSNPPSGPGRGCDNSAATGGAILSASGIAYLAMDSLVLTTSGELPTAFSMVMQGNAGIAHGLVFGQGVRCLGGTIIRRLFIKRAVGGSITAPDSSAGDQTVSARSAAKGDVIQPGQSRWYLVYYRDPIIVGGCPANSAFNATQTGQVSWWP